ncbi:MAG: hypothetical protein AB7F43_01975 [Bacteriovoracia bacterium]
MNDFDVLGSLATKLHHDFVNLFYICLPVFFALALALDWFRNPTGSADFIDTLKRAFIATLLLVSFQEITDTILAISSGIADRIDNLNGLESIYKMAGEKVKTYTLSPTSALLLGNDLIVGVVTFISYLILYVARYITVALYHFMWIFLSISAPLLILFNLFKGTAHITVNLFKSMIEVASYKIVWAIMSAMITSLSFGNAYAADGNYLTVILLNFVIAIAMLCTPLIVKSLVGGGLSAMGQSLSTGAAVALASVPAKAATAISAGREVLSNTGGWMNHFGNKMSSHMPRMQAVQQPDPIFEHARTHPELNPSQTEQNTNTDARKIPSPPKK